MAGIVSGGAGAGTTFQVVAGNHGRLASSDGLREEQPVGCVKRGRGVRYTRDEG